MDQIESHVDIFQCLIASQAVYLENPGEYIQNDEGFTKDSKTLNKIKELIVSTKFFMMRYMICTYPEKKMIVAFRGTDPNDKNDIRTNISMYNSSFEEFQGKVHSGFFARSNSVPLEFFTKKLKDGNKIFFTGHSLGAAVAALTALRLLLQEKKNSSDYIEKISCIGFGSPLIGDEIFAKSVNQSFKNHFHFIINENDLIPKLLFHKIRDESKKNKKPKKEKKKNNEVSSSLIKFSNNEQFLREKTAEKIGENQNQTAPIAAKDQELLAKEIVENLIEKVKQIRVTESNGMETNVNLEIEEQQSIDHDSLISEEISEQELIETQIEQVKEEIAEQELIRSKTEQSSQIEDLNKTDLIFRKKCENLRVFLKRLNVLNEKQKINNNLNKQEENEYESDEDDFESNQNDSPHSLQIINSSKISLDSLEKNETSNQIDSNKNEKEDAAYILKQMQEAEESMRQLNLLLDVAVEQNKDKIELSTKKTSIWDKFSLKKTKNTGLIHKETGKEAEAAKNLPKIPSKNYVTKSKSYDLSQEVILKPLSEKVIDQEDLKLAKIDDKNSGKIKWRLLPKSRSNNFQTESDSSSKISDNITKGEENLEHGEIKDHARGGQSAPKANKNSLMKALLKKIPRGTAFGRFHHMVLEDGKIVIVKNYDTESPDMINFYNQYKPNDRQSKYNYIKKNMNFHFIINYRENFLKLVPDLSMENNFPISIYKECFIPDNISDDFYKLICFKNTKLSSVNLILELSKQLENIEFIFDVELNIPELNMKIKLFEPFLVKPSAKKGNVVYVYNFLLKKSELKGMLTVNSSEIILYSHFNQSVIRFPNSVYRVCLNNFLEYRSMLDSNYLDDNNGAMLSTDNDSIIHSKIEPISDGKETSNEIKTEINSENNIDDMTEFWSTNL